MTLFFVRWAQIDLLTYLLGPIMMMMMMMMMMITPVILAVSTMHIRSSVNANTARIMSTVIEYVLL